MRGREGEIIRGLVGEEHRDRYLTDAWFKVHVDSLAGYIKILMDGLAQQAEETRAERELMVEQITERPSEDGVRYRRRGS